MAVLDISIPLQYIKSGTLSQRLASGQFEGQIYYATDVDLSYVWDGTEWQETTVNLNNVNKLIGLNALNILDLTAQSSLTAGINANFERDIYTDANGYLNTINTTNTTSPFYFNQYLNYGVKENYDGGTTQATGVNEITIDCFALTEGLISEFKMQNTESLTLSFRVQIIQDSNILATKTISVPEKSTMVFSFLNSDYSSYIQEGNFQINLFCSYSNKVIPNSSPTSFSGDFFSFTNQTVPYSSDGTNKIVYLSLEKKDFLVETNAQTIESGFTKFMIVSNEETTGTGSVSYDITFNSDAENPTYQEDLESFKEYSIEEAGTSLILKQKLNAGASSGEASAYNWGVLLW